jgi:hypothetical protein
MTTLVEEAVERLPCPFCKGINLSIACNGDGNEWVVCETDGCSAEGPMARTNVGENAADKWNTRTILDALPRVDEGKQALEYYHASTCPCVTHECYVADCPKHGYLSQDKAG